MWWDRGSGTWQYSDNDKKGGNWKLDISWSSLSQRKMNKKIHCTCSCIDPQNNLAIGDPKKIPNKQKQFNENQKNHNNRAIFCFVKKHENVWPKHFLKLTLWEVSRSFSKQMPPLNLSEWISKKMGPWKKINLENKIFLPFSDNTFSQWTKY